MVPTGRSTGAAEAIVYREMKVDGGKVAAPLAKLDPESTNRE